MGARTFDVIEERTLKVALQLFKKALERKLASAISEGVKAAYRSELEAVGRLLTKF